MATRKSKPRKETREKMRSYTRAAFHGLLNKAVKTPAQKASAK